MLIYFVCSFLVYKVCGYSSTTINLDDVEPEQLHGNGQEKTKSGGELVAKIFGILIGCALMATIGIFVLYSKYQSYQKEKCEKNITDENVQRNETDLGPKEKLSISLEDNEQRTVTVTKKSRKSSWRSEKV